MGAALSFYAIFSIVPILTIILMIIKPLLNESSIQTAIIGQVRTIINIQSADYIQSILMGLKQTKFDLYTIFISIGALVVGAVGVFYELKNSLDDLWDTNRTSKAMRNWRYFFSSRLVSLSMIPILGLLLIISLIFSTFLSFISGYTPILSNMTFLFQLSTFVFSFFVLLCLFTFVYRFLPERKLPWKELFRGALITTVLFLIGKYIIGIYITELAGTSVFGATGAFVVLLLWIYYSVEIFLFGASLTFVYSKRYGHLKDQ
jgi:membrane protein